MIAKFDHNPAPAHLVGDSTRRPGTGKRIEDKIAGVGGDFKHSINQSFWLRGLKYRRVRWHNGHHFLFCFLRVANRVVKPNCLRYDAFHYLC